jgi:hypothetical protein
VKAITVGERTARARPHGVNGIGDAPGVDITNFGEIVMLKLIASAFLVVGSAGAASADRVSSLEMRHERSSATLSDSTAAQRVAAAKVQRSAAALRSSEQLLRTMQRQLDVKTNEWNKAVAAHQLLRAQQLDKQIAALRERAERAEVRRDLERAHLQLVRADYQRSKDRVYEAAGGRRAIRNGGAG